MLLVCVPLLEECWVEAMNLLCAAGWMPVAAAVTEVCMSLFAGSLQGLHNAQASYNMQTVQNSMSSRNQGLGGSPSSGGHQSTGNLQGSRFTSNNLPVGFAQVTSVWWVWEVGRFAG